MIKANDEQLKNKTPTYYAILIILALIPQILGFNSTVIADVWKAVVLFAILVLISIKSRRITLTMIGIFYILFFVSINAINLIVDTNVGISTVINFGTGVLLVYLFFDCPIREKNISEDDVLKFFKIFSLFMFVACIYNVIANFNLLLNITSISIYGGNATSSFFDNKNTFGVFLIFGTISAFYLKVIENKMRWLLLMIVFLVNETMAMCRTAIVLTFVFLIVSFLIGDKKTRKIRILMLVGLIIFALIFYNTSSGLYGFINNNLFGNTNSLDTRDGYVNNMLPLANGIHLFFGYGIEQSRQLAYRYTGNIYYHNTYLHLLISGGLLRLAFFVVGVLHSLLNVIKLRKMNRQSGNMCIVTIIAYLIYASVESTILFDTPIPAMLATIFVISIPRLLLNAETNNRKIY